MTRTLSDDCKWAMRHHRRLLAKNPKLKTHEGAFVPSLFIITLLSSCQLVLAHYVSRYVHSYGLLLVLAFVNANTIYYSLSTFVHENSHGLIVGHYLRDVASLILETGMMSFGGIIHYMHVHRIHHHPNVNNFSHDSECPKLDSDGILSALVPFHALIRTNENREFRANKRPLTGSAAHVLALFCLCQCAVYVHYAAYQGLLFRLLTLCIFTSKFSVMLEGQSISEHYSDLTGNFDKPVLSTYGTIESVLSFRSSYHTEHHIFPNISWFYLREVTKTDVAFFEQHENKASYVSLWWRWFRRGFPVHRVCKST